MLDITGGEVIMILLVALFVLGPERLPEVAKTAGQAYSKLKKTVSGLQSEVADVMDDPAMKPLREVSEFVAQPRKKLSDLAREADKALAAETDSASTEDAGDSPELSNQGNADAAESSGDHVEKPKSSSAMDESSDGGENLSE